MIETSATAESPSRQTRGRATVLLAGFLVCFLVVLASCGGVSLAKLPAGNAQHGISVFAQNCAKCHSLGSEEKDGPSLQHIGSQVSSDKLQLIIEQGLGSMDGGLVSGQDEADVIAFLETQK